MELINKNLSKFIEVDKFIKEFDLNESTIFSESFQFAIDSNETNNEIISYFIDIEILYSISLNRIWLSSNFFVYILANFICSKFDIERQQVKKRIEKMLYQAKNSKVNYIRNNNSIDKNFVVYLTCKTLSGNEQDIKFLSNSIGNEILKKINQIAEDLSLDEEDKYSFYNEYDQLIFESIVDISSFIEKDAFFLQKLDLYYHIVEKGVYCYTVFKEIDDIFQILVEIGVQKSLKRKDFITLIYGSNLGILQDDESAKLVDKLVELDLIFISNISANKNLFQYSLTPKSIKFTQFAASDKILSFIKDDLDLIKQYHIVYQNAVKNKMDTNQKSVLQNNLKSITEKYPFIHF